MSRFLFGAKNVLHLYFHVYGGAHTIDEKVEKLQSDSCSRNQHKACMNMNLHLRRCCIGLNGEVFIKIAVEADEARLCLT